MSIYEITLQDPTGQVAPPEHILHLASVDDLVFVTIAKYDEGSTKRTHETVADITVSLPALREAIELLSHDRDREAARLVDRSGERTARIGGTRYTVAPL